MKRVALVTLAAATLLLGALVLLVAGGLPSRSEVRALAQSRPETTALMRQREAEANAAGRRPRRVQTWVPLSRVSRNLIQAVVASEDQRFFAHEGVDWTAVRESFEENVEAGRAARGGSTITQQLAKNLFFGTRKTVLRKGRELLVARWLEEDLTKPRILELYLNVIEWGDGTWGCEAAARHWFGVSAARLRRREAAGLAAMIPNPRRINPRVSPKGHDRLTRRVLWLMDLGRAVAHDVAGLGADPPAEVAAGPVAIPPDLDLDELVLEESEEGEGARGAGQPPGEGIPGEPGPAEPGPGGPPSGPGEPPSPPGAGVDPDSADDPQAEPDPTPTATPGPPGDEEPPPPR